MLEIAGAVQSPQTVDRLVVSVRRTAASLGNDPSGNPPLATQALEAPAAGASGSTSTSVLPNPQNTNPALLSTVFLSHSGDGNGPIDVSVAVELFKGTTLRLRTVSRVSVPHDRVETRRVNLDFLCLDALFCDEAAGQTCAQGSCVPTAQALPVPPETGDTCVDVDACATSFAPLAIASAIAGDATTGCVAAGVGLASTKVLLARIPPDAPGCEDQEMPCLVPLGNRRRFSRRQPSFGRLRKTREQPDRGPGDGFVWRRRRFAVGVPEGHRGGPWSTPWRPANLVTRWHYRSGGGAAGGAWAAGHGTSIGAPSVVGGAVRGRCWGNSRWDD